MKRAIHPVAWALMAGAVALAVLGQWPFAVLAVLGAVASMALRTMAANRGVRESDVLEDVGNEDRARLAPLRRLRNDIVELVERKRDDVTISVVGQEAAAEADQILAQAVRMLKLRRELVKAAAGRLEAERELRALDQELAKAETHAERESLNSAIEARRAELGHYASADSANERIAVSLRQAEAALSEMKARLTTAAAGGIGQAQEESDLRDTIGRLKSLGSSLDEAEAFLRGGR